MAAPNPHPLGVPQPRTSWALSNSPGSLSSSGDFEIGSSLLNDCLDVPQEFVDLTLRGCDRAVHIRETKENCLMQDLPAETTRDLFTPIEVGPLTLPNRIVMAPLTRSRAGPDNVPTPLSALYYAQRASAGLIISEATQVAPEGQGYISTPGIYSAEQVAGWKCVTSAVHASGGRMVLQLWHVGRISHPSFQPGGVLPIAPSAIRPNAKAFTANGFEEIPTPRALH